MGGLPFKFVENEAFIEYTSTLDENLTLPSRHKISNDVAIYYFDERKIVGLLK